MDTGKNLDVSNEGEGTRAIKLAILSVGFAGICALFISAFAWFQPDKFSLSDRYFPSPTATITPTPMPTPTITFTPTVTNTPTPTYTPTPNAATREAVQTALQATVVHAAEEWQIFFAETFDNNLSRWQIGTDDDEIRTITYEVTEGKYIWKTKANKEFIGWVDVATASSPNVYFSAEARQVRGAANADYGLIFRKDAHGNCYYFGINSMKRYTLRRFYNGIWSELIDWTTSATIRSDALNRLTVLAEDDHIILFINDQFVGEAHDKLIKEGTFALAVELYATGHEAIFEFDTIELRAP